jgi:predicted RNA-binding protein YlqC (UPF0109 family)
MVKSDGGPDGQPDAGKPAAGKPMLKELLETLASELVDEPERVSVTEWDEGGSTLLELSVAPEDRGLVIGKGGRTADALRTLLDAVAERRGSHCDVEVVD